MVKYIPDPEELEALVAELASTGIRAAPDEDAITFQKRVIEAVYADLDAPSDALDPLDSRPLDAPLRLEAEAFVARVQQRAKNKLLAIDQDTTNATSYHEYSGLVQDHGFLNAHTHQTQLKYCAQVDEFSLWYKESNGLLLLLESYGGRRSINRAEVFFQLRMTKDEQFCSEYTRLLEDLSCRSISAWDYSVLSMPISSDVRLGFKKTMRTLDASRLASPWPQPHDALCVLDSNERNLAFAIWDRAQNERLSSLPPSAQRMIGLSEMTTPAGHVQHTYRVQ